MVSDRLIKSPDWLLIEYMQKVGKEFIKKRHPEQIKDYGFRMGFHGPGRISVNHLHLHLIVLPFEKKIEHF